MTLGTLGPEECPLCWRFDCKCWTAKAIEARSAETERLGPKDESAVANGDLPKGHRQ